MSVKTLLQLDRLIKEFIFPLIDRVHIPPKLPGDKQEKVFFKTNVNCGVHVAASICAPLLEQCGLLETRC